MLPNDANPNHADSVTTVTVFVMFDRSFCRRRNQQSVSALSRVVDDVRGGGGVTWFEGVCSWRCKYSIPACVFEKGGGD